MGTEAHGMDGKAVRLLAQRNLSCVEPLQGYHASRTKRVLSGHTYMNIRKLSKVMTVVSRLLEGYVLALIENVRRDFDERAISALSHDKTIPVFAIPVFE